MRSMRTGLKAVRAVQLKGLSKQRAKALTIISWECDGQAGIMIEHLSLWQHQGKLTRRRRRHKVTRPDHARSVNHFAALHTMKRAHRTHNGCLPVEEVVVIGWARRA